MNQTTLSRISEARRFQFARYLGYRAIGYSPRMAFILSIRPI